MPILSGPQIISELRTQLNNPSGRHLYAVIGTYQQLASFEINDLSAAYTSGNQPFPLPVNFNQVLLKNIEDEALRKMVRDENRRLETVRGQLNHAFDQVLRNYYSQHNFLILKQIEMIFAFGLDIAKFRINAVNQNHLLLLLPGRKAGGDVQLFHEADSRFQSTFPGALIIETNLWELKS